MAELRTLKRRAGIAEEVVRTSSRSGSQHAGGDARVRGGAHNIHRILESAGAEMGTALRHAGSAGAERRCEARRHIVIESEFDSE